MVGVTCVIVCWLEGYDDKAEVRTLAYDSGRGRIRVYVKDNYDPRMDMFRSEKLPFFSEASAALKHMIESRKKGAETYCQIDVGDVHKLKFKPQDLDTEFLAQCGYKILKTKVKK